MPSVEELQADPIYAEFCSETREILDRIRLICRGLNPGPADDRIREVLRHFHTVKGNAAMFELANTEKTAHELETHLGKFKSEGADVSADDIARIQMAADVIDGLLDAFDQLSAQSDNETPSAALDEMIRVPLKRVNDALTYTWEIFLLRNQLSYLIESHISSSDPANYEFLQTWEMIDSAMRRNIAELEQASMSMRMRTISVIYDRIEKVSRAYLAKNDKQVRITREGEGVEVDKRVVDLLAEPMVHLIRNALDHGIESAESRVAAGKPAEGTIALATHVEGDHVIIAVSDDGAGVDTAKVLAKARAKGIDVGPNPSEQRVLDLIFHPGLSTASSVTNVSGRGVGTDAVKAAVAEMGGTVQVASELGTGTSFVISLPLSMSVLDALLFEVNGALYASSIAAVIEVCRVEVSELHQLGSDCFFEFRGSFIPCVDARRVIGTRNDSDHGEVSLVILSIRGTFVALRVSRVLQHVEVVLKALPAGAPSSPAVTGFSILHTGRPVFVLDLVEIADLGTSGSALVANGAARAH